MSSNTKSKMTTNQLTAAAILTAIVFVLQYFGRIPVGTFAMATVLIPIVIGAVVCGTWVAAWLGLVFGAAVLLSGDAALFLGFNAPATVFVVLLKGVCCGLAAGLVYKAVRKISNEYLAVISAAVVCPIVNTGIFFLGCLAFFMDGVSGYAASNEWTGSTVGYILLIFIGVNFLLELAINIFFAPIVARIVKIIKK